MAGLSRRDLLRGGAAGVGAVVLSQFGALPAVALAPDGTGPSFLTADELRLLGGLVDRFLPGPPESTEPGAADVGVPEAIDALLAAFEVDPPCIYAGAPFSDRGGHPVNQFASFLPLDAYEEKAWRLRILGSQGDPSLEFNGPVQGLQTTYRDGLAALADAGFDPDAPGPARDLVLQTSGDARIAAVVDVALPHAVELMYGPPEYGGNRDLAAWESIGFDGDVHPTGYTDEQVEQLDPDDQTDLLVLPPGFDLDDLLAAAAFASSDAGYGTAFAAGGSMAALRASLAPIRDRGA